MQLFFTWLSLLSAFDWLIVPEEGSGSWASGTASLTSLSGFFSFVLVGSLCSSNFFRILTGSLFAGYWLVCQCGQKTRAGDEPGLEFPAPLFLSQTQLVATRFFHHLHWPRTWPFQLNTLHSFCYNTSYLFPSLSVVNVNPNMIRPCWVEMLHKLVWPVLL